MALSRVRYEVDGNTDTFNVPFGYISKNHVKVLVNNAPTVIKPKWVNQSTLRLDYKFPAGTVVDVYRDTPRHVTLVDFQNGSVLTEEELDKAHLQNLYISQEITDKYEQQLGNALETLAVGNGLAVGTTPEETMDNIVAAILNDEAAEELNQRIVDIDLNAETLMDQGTRVSDMEFRVDQFGTTSADGTALVLNMDGVRVDETTSLAVKFSTIETEVGQNTASVTELSTAVDGLEARYGVSLNVNGYITGFAQNNDGSTGTFSVLADKFYIVDPTNGGQTPKSVFAVVNGVTYIQNVVVQDAQIENLAVGKLITGDLNADMKVGTGKIVWDNGTYMKVAGVGFGSTGQFLEWFGPKLASYADCTESNAIQYLKTDGSAYFGGSLSAGTLYNAGATTTIQVPCEVVVGPFATNGGSKKVVTSYSYSASASAPSDTSGPISAVVKLYRKIGTSAYSLVATYTFDGERTAFYDAETGSWDTTENISGAYTYTDSDTSTADRTLKAVLESRDTNLVENQTQRLSVKSTEE